jgi:tetratricopeptide (TPR) repeat protein
MVKMAGQPVVDSSVTNRGKQLWGFLWPKSRRLKSLFLIIIIILGVAAYMVWRWNDSNKAPAGTDGPMQYEPYASAESSQIVDQATVLTRQMKYTDAIKVLDDYIASGQADKKEKAYVLMQKGYTLADYLKNYEQAANAYQEAIELTPNDPMLYAGLGQVLETEGKLNEAKEQYQKALQVYDEDLTDNYKGKNREYFLSLINGRSYEDLMKAAQ